VTPGDLVSITWTGLVFVGIIAAVIVAAMVLGYRLMRSGQAPRNRRIRLGLFLERHLDDIEAEQPWPPLDPNRPPPTVWPGPDDTKEIPPRLR
jgi:hypothetical protein